MTAYAKRIGIATGATAGLNALLFLAAAWALAVARGLQSSGSRKTTLDAPEKAITLVLTPAEPPASPKVPAERPYVHASDRVPEQAPAGPAAFQSSRNLRAASEVAPPTPDAPAIPAIDGTAKRFPDLEDSRFRDGALDRAASAESGSVATPSPGEIPPDAAESNTDSRTAGEPLIDTLPVEANPQESVPAFRDDASPSLVSDLKPARRNATAPPGMSAGPAASERDSGVYQPEKRKALSRGSVSNRSSMASVDAEATPEGRYGKTIYGIIGRNWHRKMHSMGGLVSAGLVEVDFEIDLSGRISNVRLANPGEANPVMQDCALSAVLHAKLPPPPEELVTAMRDRITGGRFPQRMSFLSY